MFGPWVPVRTLSEAERLLRTDVEDALANVKSGFDRASSAAVLAVHGSGEIVVVQFFSERGGTGIVIRVTRTARPTSLAGTSTRWMSAEAPERCDRGAKLATTRRERVLDTGRDFCVRRSGQEAGGLQLSEPRGHQPGIHSRERALDLSEASWSVQQGFDDVKRPFAPDELHRAR